MRNKITYYNRNWEYENLAEDFVYAIWDNESTFLIATFKTREQLDKFAELLGFTYTLDDNLCGECSKEIRRHYKDKEIRMYFEEVFNKAHKSTDKKEKEECRKLLNEWYESECLAYGITAENLQVAKKFKSLCNGSIVDNYFISTEDEVRVYTCNPNSKTYYKPLTTQEHIEFQRKYGSY